MPDNLSNNQGLFVPTTNIYDVIPDIYELDVNSREFKELIVRLYQNLNIIATAVNMKDSGYYDTNEFVCGQLFFPNPAIAATSSVQPQYRNVYRKVINFGPLPNNATTTVAHNITFGVNTSFTFIMGVATDPNDAGTGFHAISFVSTDNNDIAVYVDATNVRVVTQADFSNYLTCYIILEYMQN